MSKIVHISAREILDSRGDPTVEATVVAEHDVRGVASVPSGASRGSGEAHELRDAERHRYWGKGVRQAVRNVDVTIARALRGKEVTDQKGIDGTLIKLDGTAQKDNLGGNALLAVSLASARAGANVSGLPLYAYLRVLYSLPSHSGLMPVPMMNIINGGKHADTNLDIQEIMVVPHLEQTKSAHTTRRTLSHFAEMVRAGSEIYHALGTVLHEQGFDTDVGGEGGYAPNMDSTVGALNLVMEGILRAGYAPGRDVSMAMDVGASTLYDERKKAYFLSLDGALMTSAQLIEVYHEWQHTYPLIALEDGLAEDDWDAWKVLTSQMRRASKKFLVVGDDLFVTNIQRLKKGIKKGTANAIIIKPNQIGTLTEAVHTATYAALNGYTLVASHRSGETEDTFIADLAVALGCRYIKAGAPARGERTAKYNRLMAIERELVR